MNYDDTGIFSIPGTETGSETEDELGQIDADLPDAEVQYTGECDINDKSFHQNRVLSGSGKLEAYGTIMLPVSVDVMAISIDATFVGTYLETENTRTGVVVGVTVLGNLIDVRWLSSTT